MESPSRNNPGGSAYAIIPARAGSRRIPGKNLALVNGKPLLAYTIETARSSSVFDRVIVNSEDAQILDVAATYGAEGYRRPSALASDTAFVIEAVQEMIATLALPDKVVVGVLLPTCPLRTLEDIIESYRIFKTHGCHHPVVSVSKFETPIQLALRITKENYLEPMFPDAYRKSTRTNDQPLSYRANYAVIFNTAGNLKDQTNLIGQHPIPYVMPSERSIDIDESFEMKLAETLLNSGDSRNIR